MNDTEDSLRTELKLLHDDVHYMTLNLNTPAAPATSLHMNNKDTEVAAC